MTEKKYDVVIIGSGPAGMTAAMYTARSEMKTLLLERGVPGGQMNNTAEIENYPGYETIMGPELSMKMAEHLEGLGVENAYGFVTAIEDHGDYKKIITEDDEFVTKSIIIATGANHRKLEIPGEEEYGARGVSYCAVCDGAFFRNQEILVIGGGDSAVEEALYLTRFGQSVTIMHRRDKLRAQEIIQQRAFKEEKINFIWDSVPMEIKGDDKKVQSVVYKNVKTGEVTEKAFGGIFIYVGLDPVAEFAGNLGITDEAGWIITDDHMRTSLPGIFAVGDVRQKDFRQITTAIGDGAQAAQEAYKFVAELD